MKAPAKRARAFNLDAVPVVLRKSKGKGGHTGRTAPPESDSWNTPALWIERATRALGGPIDFDPCKAAAHDAVHAVDGCLWPGRNGLSEAWAGRVWCNPPYSDMGRWWGKIAEEAAARERVVSMLVLAPLRPSSRWWRELAAAADWLGVPRSRIPFVSSKTGRAESTGRAELTFFGWRLARPEALQVMRLDVCDLVDQVVLFA